MQEAFKLDLPITSIDCKLWSIIFAPLFKTEVVNRGSVDTVMGSADITKVKECSLLQTFLTEICGSTSSTF